LPQFARFELTLYLTATITIVFLPITFLAGYFGMNFETFPAVQMQSDAFFWKVATPLIVITLMYCLREVVGRQIIKKLQRRSLKVARQKRRDKQE